MELSEHHVTLFFFSEVGSVAVDVAAVPFSLSNLIEIGNSIRDGYGLDSGLLCEDQCPSDVISLRRESTDSTASDKLETGSGCREQV